MVRACVTQLVSILTVSGQRRVLGMLLELSPTYPLSRCELTLIHSPITVQRTVKIANDILMEIYDFI